MIPGLGRCPGERKGYPLQYSGLENSMDCIVYGVPKRWTQLSDFHFHFSIKLKWGGTVKSLQFCLHDKLELCASTLKPLHSNTAPYPGHPSHPTCSRCHGRASSTRLPGGKAPIGVLTTHGSHLLPALPHLPQPDRTSLSSLELHPSQTTALI